MLHLLFVCGSVSCIARESSAFEGGILAVDDNPRKKMSILKSVYTHQVKSDNHSDPFFLKTTVDPDIEDNNPRKHLFSSMQLSATCQSFHYPT